MSGMPTAPYQEFSRTKLGYEFSNIDLLVTAMTHRSYVNEHRKSVFEHNERLEFLGDAGQHDFRGEAVVLGNLSAVVRLSCWAP